MKRLLSLGAALLLSSCAVGSNWYLMEAGYSIKPLDGDPDLYAIEVHLNQLQQLGGEVNSAEFRLFLSRRLQWHGICPNGWHPLPCVLDGSCVQHTRRSVTVPIHCAAS